MADGEPTRQDDQPAGCGVQGCLTAAVALFVILLLWLIFIMLIRFSEPPQPRFGAATPVAPAATDVAATTSAPAMPATSVGSITAPARAARDV